MCHVDVPVEERLVCGLKGDVFLLRSSVSLPLGQSEAVSSPVFEFDREKTSDEETSYSFCPTCRNPTLLKTTSKCFHL